MEEQKKRPEKPGFDHDLTRLIERASAGDAAAMEQLIDRVYDELIRMARGIRWKDRTNATLHPTALVNEAWIRIFGKGKFEAPSRAYFFAAMAQAMRRILIDHSRRRAAANKAKNKLGKDKEEFWNRLLKELERSQKVDYMALEEALEELKQLSERQYKVVTLRFFGGLKLKEIKDHLNVSLSTVEKDWQAARAWLYRHLQGGAK